MSIPISHCVHLCLPDGLSAPCLSPAAAWKHTHKHVLTNAYKYTWAHTALTAWLEPQWGWCKTPSNWAGGSCTRKWIHSRPKDHVLLRAARILGDDWVCTDCCLGGSPEKNARAGGSWKEREKNVKRWIRLPLCFSLTFFLYLGIQTIRLFNFSPTFLKVYVVVGCVLGCCSVPHREATECVRPSGIVGCLFLKLLLTTAAAIPMIIYTYLK